MFCGLRCLYLFRAQRACEQCFNRMLPSGGWAVGGVDQTAGLLNDLRARAPEMRSRAAQALRQFIENISLELAGDAFARFMSDLNKRIGDLVQSPVEADRLGGIEAIEQLIEVESEERTTNLPRFANYLRVAIGSTEITTISAATIALGHLARVGGALVSDAVEFEVKRALDWLNTERSEFRRVAALQVIQQLASASATLFHAHIATFFDVIWSALRDAHATVREAATGALRAVLGIIASREGRARWMERLYEEANKSLKGNGDSVHGGLLALTELLLADREFMSRYMRDVADASFKLRDNSNRAVRRAVVQILPALACVQYARVQ